MTRLTALLRSPLPPLLAVLVAVLVIAANLAPPPGQEAGLVPRPLYAALPYLLGVIAAATALFFQSANTVLVAAAIALGHGFLGFMPPTPIPILGPPSFRPEIVAIALPAIAVLALGFSERGLVNRHGALRATLAAAVVVALLAALYAWPTAAEDLRRAQFLPELLTGWTRLSDAGLVAALLGLGGVAGLAYYRAGPMAAAVTLATATAVAAIAVPLGTATQTATVLAAQAVLVMGGLQSGYRLAFFDQLTGLPNRRALDLRLTRLGADYTLAMLDVDHFKSFNDTYGHEAGDNVLKLVAGVLRGTGGGGKPYRYGGEEFCIVFPGREPEACQTALEELRAAVAGKSFVVRQPDRPKDPKQGQKQRGKGKGGKTKSRDKTVPITISLGAAGPQGLTDNPEAVLKRADEALYKAKEGGRNCLKLAG